MKDEKFCKYLLYRLIDRVLSEIRFEVKTESTRSDKIFTLSNFVIDLPLELHRITNENNPKKYFDLVKNYEEYSKRIKIDEWFNDFKDSTYSIFEMQNKSNK